MTSENPTCGEALIRLLESYGVDTVFGIPGVHTLEIYRGLVGSPIRHVLARHEQGAAFMADGYARATGKPGVCIVITGPGVTNAATGIAEAYADSQPVLCISSVGPRATLGKGWGELHEVDDQRAVTTPFTAFSATALSPEEVPGLVHRAFAVFASQRPRPVHLEIPLDVLALPAGGYWPPVAPPNRPSAPQADLARAAALLETAKKPLIFAGGGALHAGAAIAALAARRAIPVLTTVAGNGTIDDADPLALGPRIASDAIRAYTKEADVVLGVGTEWSTFEGSVKGPIPITGKLIRIDIDPRKLVDRLQADVALHADAKTAIEGILAATHDAGDDARRQAAATVAALRAESDAKLPELQRKHMRIGAALKQALPADGIVVTDMTQIAYTFRANLGWDRPRRFLHPKGYGTLGYGLPAAIGVKAADPARPVVVFAGDGGIMYTLGEMATAADEKLNVVLIVWNNAALADIRDAFVEIGLPPVATAPTPPDFIALAKAMNWRGARAADIAQFDAELRAALKADAPTLIELRESDPF